jgi:hypothetical protein
MNLYLRALLVSLIAVIGIWTIGYLSIHATAVQSGLQVDFAGSPVSVITPRVAWELSAAMVAVSFAMTYLSWLLVEGMEGKRRLAVLLGLTVVLVACIGLGLTSEIVIKDEGYSMLSRSFFLGSASPYSYLMLGGVAASALLTVKNMDRSRSDLSVTST